MDRVNRAHRKYYVFNLTVSVDITQEPQSKGLFWNSLVLS